MQTRLVIFDAFNTLVRPVPGLENTFVTALGNAGIDATPAVMARLQSASAGLEHREWSRSRADYVDWTAATLRKLTPSTIAAAAPRIIPALEQWHQAPMQMFPDVAGCIPALRERGIAIAICSNWGWDLPEDLAQAQVSDWIDVVVSSAAAGWRKPNSAIYRTVLDVAGVEADRAVFVGDNIDADVRGPQRAGIRSILLDRAGSDVDGYATITSLCDLLLHLQP
jgi:putative hydrolase of the HAD superfamily